LEKANRYGLAANILTVSEHFDSVAQDFFSKIQSPDHYLHSVLSEEKTSSLALRPRGHQFLLPTCVYRLFKCSFVNHCLFKFVHFAIVFYAFTFVLCNKDLGLLLTYLLRLWSSLALQCDVTLWLCSGRAERITLLTCWRGLYQASRLYATEYEWRWYCRSPRDPIPTDSRATAIHQPSPTT